MKNQALFLMLVCAAVIATGCDKKRTAFGQLDRVQAKTADVAQDMRNDTYAQKDEVSEQTRGLSESCVECD